MTPFKKTPLRRAVFFVAGDVVLLGLSVWLSFLLRFGGNAPDVYAIKVLPLAALIVLLKLPVFGLSGVYRISWSYFGMFEMWKIVKALAFSFLILAGASFILRDLPLFLGMPRSILFIDFFCSLFLVSGLRISKRFYLHVIRASHRGEGKRTLIVGAGDAGEQIVRETTMDGNTIKVSPPIALGAGANQFLFKLHQQQGNTTIRRRMYVIYADYMLVIKNFGMQVNLLPQLICNRLGTYCRCLKGYLY